MSVEDRKRVMIEFTANKQQRRCKGLSGNWVQMVQEVWRQRPGHFVRRGYPRSSAYMDEGASGGPVGEDVGVDLLADMGRKRQ